MPTYTVLVGNIGQVHEGQSRDEARKRYDEYVVQSNSGIGRAGHEQVTLFEDGEPIAEHDPDEQEEESEGEVEQEEEEEPEYQLEEGDWVTEDHRTFREHLGGSRSVPIEVGDDEDWRDVVKERMEADQFWPNVWSLSDHGNLHLLSLEKEKE